ncbi:putative myosin regulatory light chain [Neospora caninum Liverpool]|uniref:Myosin regulatory light chain, putative n=1 Tax=Neospora caninum (strain Liverpool) TaxID=572307 RepID=F0VNX6_NEOCL|nr:putative myosin regulatory light chain [Neospora caninum Liverpool]CBZ55422.1 putative myosin regulatory light chain [Neospora caninum Liverpool]CEL70158.1 TPA: myosin regulatory light chain, putative [Neospora caninum Liverpool]|eukprot:XP_003885450.1 putative myosin regulatory light chain [Neospora caninum Liverpool]
MMSNLVRPIKLQEQHLRLIYDDFRLLDENRDGFIDQIQYATLVRALGQTVSDREIDRSWQIALEEQRKQNEEAKAAQEKKEAQAKKEAAPGTLGLPKKQPPPKPVAPPQNEVNFQVFTKVFAENYIPVISEKTLRQAFQLFDPKNTGKLSSQQLQDIVMNRGEPLSKAEFDELVLLAGLDGQKSFDYTQLVKRLLKGPAGIATINATR